MRLLALVVLILLAPLASAGSAEAPEVVDAAGDCAFPPGNHYMDVVAVWISDETADAFNVNIQLSEWVAPAAEGAGFAIQFKHQGVEFGVLAGYFAQTWGYGNGRVSDSEIESYNETSGSFKASPPVITVLFQKNNFPHANAMDNKLVDFTGGSIDLKPLEPFFLVPAPLPAYPPGLECDTVQGTIPYEFQVGQHAHDMSAMNSTAETNTTATPDSLENTAAPTPSEPAKSVPGFQAVAVVVALAALAARRR